MINRIVAACVAALALILAGAATAQTTPPAPSTAINFAPLLNEVVWPLVIALAGVLATWLSAKLAKWLGLKNADEVRKYVEPALQNALAYGQAATGKLPLTVETKSQIVATAANFAIAHVADGLKMLGIDRDGLIRMLQARLEANVSAQIPDVTATAASTMPTTVAKPAEPVAVPVPAAGA